MVFHHGSTGCLLFDEVKGQGMWTPNPKRSFSLSTLNDTVCRWQTEGYPRPSMVHQVAPCFCKTRVICMAACVMNVRTIDDAED